jgi:DNA end-binding protein Ku
LRLKKAAAANGAASDPAFRDKMVVAEIEVLALAAAYEHAVALTRAGRQLGPETSFLKLAASELAQHLAALEVVKDAMVLTMMRYGEELVDMSQYHFPAAKDVRKPELEMAKTLVKNLADTWDPAQYTDEYRENLMKIIKAKLKGKEAKLTVREEPQQAEVVDLMERLRQSLQGAGTGARKTARTRKPTARASARKKKKAA